LIEQFEVKPSILMAFFICVVHVFTFVSALYFDLPLFFYVVILLAVLISWVWSINQWSCHQHYFIKYESVYQSWSVSNDTQQWQRYENLSVAYINDALVWIILGSPGGNAMASLIGVDSMDNERFLQLRRCILCPNMFD